MGIIVVKRMWEKNRGWNGDRKENIQRCTKWKWEQRKLAADTTIILLGFHPIEDVHMFSAPLLCSLKYVKIPAVLSSEAWSTAWNIHGLFTPQMFLVILNFSNIFIFILVFAICSFSTILLAQFSVLRAIFSCIGNREGVSSHIGLWLETLTSVWKVTHLA